MKRKCDNCGMIQDEYWMHHYDIGKKSIWLCWKCYQSGEREATLSDMARGYRLHRISESKKRTK